MNNFYIGFAYNGAWEIVYGAKEAVINWIINKSASHVSGEGCKDEAEMMHKLEGYKINEAYESATIQAIA